MKKLLLFALSLLALPLLAQTRVVPDCVIPFSFTAPAATSNTTCGAPNGAPNGNGISSWILVYYSTSFSVVSLVVESAPDNGGVPGSWGTFAGTVLSSTQYPGSSGINPNTATTSAFTGFAGYYPWMRVRAATLTGSGKLTGVLMGFYNSTLARTGSGGGGTVTIAGTANEITVSGVGCSGSTGTCTISIPASAVFPGTPTVQTPPSAGDVSAAIATTNFFQGCTWSSGGNMVCPGSITSGSGSGVAGTLDLTQGTLPGSFPANAFSLYTPTSIPTSYQWRMPTADPGAGLIASDGGATPSVLSVKAIQGTDSKILSSGTVSGLGNTLCTDAQAGATTVGCNGGTGAAGSTLFSTTNSTTVTATSPTTLIDTVTGSTTVPANTFTAGQVVELVAQGFYSTPATATSLTLTLNIGGSVRLTTGVELQLASATNGVWRLLCTVTTRTTGASGTQIANCLMETTGTTLSENALILPLQTSSTWTIDTTVGEAIDVVATWSTSTGAPSITSTNIAAWIPGAPVTSVNTLTGAVVLFSPNAQTGTYSATAADFSGCKTITVASGTFTITLVASGSQPPAGQCIKAINYGSGVVTIARSGQNINGGTSSLTLNAASATAPSDAYVVSDGTNYFASVNNPGGGGGGTSVHHQYYQTASNTSAGNNMMMINGLSTSFLGNIPVGIAGTFGSGGGGVAGVMIFLPSTWSSAAGISVTADAGTVDNNTGNFSLKPQYFCIPNGYDLGPAPTYTAGSAVSVAAPGGSGSGFYRESIAMTLSSPSCSPGNSIFIAVTRPAGDTYAHNIVLYGLDIGITY